MNQATFTSDVSALSGYAFLDLNGYPALYPGGVQTVGWWAEMAGASQGDTAVLRVALVSGGAIMGYVDATLTATDVDGAYGKVATVAFSTTSTNVLDALGAGDLTAQKWASQKDTAEPHFLFAITDGIDGESCTGIRVHHTGSPNI
jgi:hypothetical protein